MCKIDKLEITNPGNANGISIQLQTIIKNEGTERSLNQLEKQFIIEGETLILEAGQSIKIEKNTRVQYSNPFDEPCEYIAICTPAFDFNKVHRE